MRERERGDSPFHAVPRYDNPQPFQPARTMGTCAWCAQHDWGTEPAIFRMYQASHEQNITATPHGCPWVIRCLQGSSGLQENKAKAGNPLNTSDGVVLVLCCVGPSTQAARHQERGNGLIWSWKGIEDFVTNFNPSHMVFTLGFTLLFLLLLF